jgi:GT2 family glycosyltransferase
MSAVPIDVSIIIPVYNNWRLTESCLRSIAEVADRSKLGIETLVVDNGSFDETERQLAEQFPKLRVRRMPKNLGFARGCNAGAADARGLSLLFLNNDTLVLPGAVDALFAARAEGVGVVGARLLYADRTIQHAGMALDRFRDWLHVFRGLPCEHPLVAQKRSFQAVTGACLLVDKARFERLNGFDEAFVNSHEDVDLCVRVRQEGLEVVYEPAATLFHYESMSSGRTLTTSRGKQEFWRKWRGKLAPDLDEKTHVFAEKTIAACQAELRELLESERSPFRVPVADWPNNGGARRFRDLTLAIALCETALPVSDRMLREIKRKVAAAVVPVIKRARFRE